MADGVSFTRPFARAPFRAVDGGAVAVGVVAGRVLREGLSRERPICLASGGSRRRSRSPPALIDELLYGHAQGMAVAKLFDPGNRRTPTLSVSIANRNAGGRAA